MAILQVNHLDLRFSSSSVRRTNVDSARLESMEELVLRLDDSPPPIDVFPTRGKSRTST